MNKIQRHIVAWFGHTNFNNTEFIFKVILCAWCTEGNLRRIFMAVFESGTRNMRNQLRESCKI